MHSTEQNHSVDDLSRRCRRRSAELRFSQVIPSVGGMNADVLTVEKRSLSPHPLITVTLLLLLRNERVTKPRLENMSLLII